MTVYILSALLLGVLAYAVFQLTKKSEVDKEIDKLTQEDESYLLAELYSVNFTVWLCFVGGLLLTANYAINYFSGSEVRYLADWGLYQWSGALIGLVVTVSITAVQKILYASPTHHKAGLLVTTLILIFVIFSEIGSPIEKEEMKMTEKSQNSATYKAVVGAINTGVGNTSPSAYSRQLATAQAGKAKHVFELGRCNRHKAKGAKRVQRCETYENREIAKYQAQIDSYSSNMKTETSSNQSTALALVDKAKALEHNTDNHSGLIKFVKEALATTYLSAMMLASLILVVAFEAGFHFAGSRAGILKAALMKMGNEDIKYASELRRHKKAQAFKRRTASLKDGDKKPPLSTPPPNWKPATQFTNNQHTGTHENQFDLFPEKIETASTENNAGMETVKATPYEEIKAEIENGKLQPSTDAIAQRIYHDSGVNLTMPKCKKVAESVVHRLEKESQNTRPSEGENRGIETAANDRPSDRTATVADDRSGTVKTISEKGTVDTLNYGVLEEDSFSKLYVHISALVSANKLKPSARSLATETHKFIKADSQLKITSISLPDCRVLANQVRDEMIKEQVITKNPDYKNGLPRYLVS